MANSFCQQFLYSKTRALTVIQGVVNIVQEVQATLLDQDVTYTAVEYGTVGNDITIELIDPGTPSEPLAISVVGNAISVTLETDGGSLILTDADALVAAINGDLDASALVTASGSGATPLVALAETNLAGGIDGVSSENLLGASVAQTGVGEYTITLDDTFNALMACNLEYQAATAVDLIPQIKSTDVSSAKTIVVRLLTGATPTDPSADGKLHVSIYLRNSSVVY